jgi:alkylmercury lyase-like protein
MTRRITVCRSAQLTPAAYGFYCAILRTFPVRGTPPEPAELVQLAERFAVPLAATLADCVAQDLLQLDAATGRIRAAYPFSGVPTMHRVTLVSGSADGGDSGGCDALDGRPGQQVYAMCALDALGIPLLLRRAATIVSHDALTNDSVEVHIAPLGTMGEASPASLATLAGWSARWDPPSAVIYARAAEHEHEHDEGCAAAGACCPITNFFADAAHAQQWAQAHQVPDGVILAPVEALARAHTLFGGVLHRVESDEEPHA